MDEHVGESDKIQLNTGIEFDGFPILTIMTIS
jgi:hypothetical protein